MARAKTYKKGTISQETYMNKKAYYFLTFSIDVAKRYQKEWKTGKIFRLPNGVYAVRKASVHKKYDRFHEIPVNKAYNR